MQIKEMEQDEMDRLEAIERNKEDIERNKEAIEHEISQGLR